MLSPRLKPFFFKILLSIFVHDYKNIVKLYRQSCNARAEMEPYLRIITPEELYEHELIHISEKMDELQRLVYHLREKGLSDKEISEKLNVPLYRIQKRLNLVEADLLKILQYID